MVTAQLSCAFVLRAQKAGFLMTWLKFEIGGFKVEIMLSKDAEGIWR